MSFERVYENYSFNISPCLKVDNRSHEAECIFHKSKIHLIRGNLEEESSEEIEDINQSNKECEKVPKESSIKEDAGVLKKVVSRFQSLDFKKIWSDEIFPDLKPTAEVLYDLKPKASSLLLDLVRRGIEVSLNQEEKASKREVVIKDFSTVVDIPFTRTGPNSATRNFNFFVHAPTAFQFFREKFGISNECFLHSICKEPLCELQGYSKTGSLYTTYDDRFLLKICEKGEAELLESFFPGYYANLTKNPKTLLPKFFGLYGYNDGKTNVRFLIMNNLFPIYINLHEKYDIKGSTYKKRKSKKITEKQQNEEIPEEMLGALVTLKDLDFLQRWPHGLYLKQKFYSLLMQSVERDCKILQSYNIMDYSLLLGIHVPTDIYWSECEDQNSSSDVCKISKSEAARLRKIKNLIGPFEARTSKGGRIHVYLGIIDILQSFTARKKFEHLFKLLIYSPKTMSVAKPDFYAERFKNFLIQSVFKCIPELILFQKKEKELIQKVLEDFPDDVEF